MPFTLNAFRFEATEALDVPFIHDSFGVHKVDSCDQAVDEINIPTFNLHAVEPRSHLPGAEPVSPPALHHITTYC